jgi:hypothetical protein
MLRIPLPVSILAAALAATVLLSKCEWTDPAGPTEELLHGTWMREYSDRDVKVRRLLRLDAGGAFRETVHAVDGAGRVTRMAHQGTWHFDGTNLKRKYDLVDGKPPSRLNNLPFATFEISFPTRDEFVGKDHVRNNEIRYERVAADSLP